MERNLSELFQGYEKLEKVTLDANSRPLPPRPGVLTTKQRKHSKEQFSRTELVFKKIHLAENAFSEWSGKLSGVFDIYYTRTLTSNISV